MTKTIHQVTYTMIDSETYRDENGGEWISDEIKDCKSKIKYAEREMAAAVRKGLLEWDNAQAYTEALDTKVNSEEDLEIMEALFA